VVGLVPTAARETHGPAGQTQGDFSHPRLAADRGSWQDGQEVTFKSGFEYDLTNTKGLPRPVTPKASNFVGIEVGLTMYHDLDPPTNIYLDDLAFGNQRIGCTP
jgi:hypothetical protein